MPSLICIAKTLEGKNPDMSFRNILRVITRADGAESPEAQSPLSKHSFLRCSNDVAMARSARRAAMVD